MSDLGLDPMMGAPEAPVEPMGMPEAPIGGAPAPDMGGMEALFGQPQLPPPPAQLIADLAQDRPVPPDPTGGVTGKDRLIAGARVLGPRKPAVEAPRPETPDVVESAAKLTGSADSLSSKNVNVAARIDQLRQTAEDPDALEATLDKLAANDLLVDRQKELFSRLKGGDGLGEDEWFELSEALTVLTPALGELDDDLSVGAGKVVAIESQQGTPALQVEFPLSDKIDDLPMSTTGDSLVLPAYTLDRTAKDFTVFVTGPEVTYAAPVTQDTDSQLRNMFPGPVGKDGIPRWAPVEALKVSDHSAIQSISLSAPGVEVDAYPDREAYVGTRAGDWITFDIPDDTQQVGQWLPPKWAEGQTEKLRGGVSRSVPEVKLAPVSKDELTDQYAVRSRLDDSAWSVVPALGDPKKTAKMLAAVKAAGYEPVEVERDGGKKGWVVFGMPGDQAADLVDGRPVFSHAGVHNPDDGYDQLEEVPRFRVRSKDGQVTEFSAPDDLATGFVPRTQQRASRLAFRVDPQQVKYIAGLAKDLEVSGASNVSLYTRSQAVEGFEQAREFLYDDGVSMRSVRTKVGRLGDSNAVPVLVRSAAGLSQDPPRLPASAINWSETQAIDDGRTVTIEAGQDLVQAARDASTLAQIVGWDRVKVVGADGEIRMHKPA